MKYMKNSKSLRKNGTIRWFDSMSGEGMVRDAETGKCYFIHFSGINGIDKNNYQWPKDSDKPFLKAIENKSCTFLILEGQAYNLTLKES